MFKRAGRVAHSTASNIALLQLPETIPIWIGLIYFLERYVHKIITVDEVPVECFAIFQFYQLRRREQCEVMLWLWVPWVCSGPHLGVTTEAESGISARKTAGRHRQRTIAECWRRRARQGKE